VHELNLSRSVYDIVCMVTIPITPFKRRFEWRFLSLGWIKANVVNCMPIFIPGVHVMTDECGECGRNYGNLFVKNTQTNVLIHLSCNFLLIIIATWTCKYSLFFSTSRHHKSRHYTWVDSTFSLLLQSPITTHHVERECDLPLNKLIGWNEINFIRIQPLNFATDVSATPVAFIGMVLITSICVLAANGSYQDHYEELNQALPKRQ